MGLIEGAIVAVGALLFLSRLLYKPPKGRTEGLGEDQPPSISTRGAWVPVHFGTIKTERVAIGWAGNREVRKESVSGGGGGKGGGSRPKQDVYYEDTVHWLGIGPARSLHQIRMNGEVIWEGPIFADDTPSGTAIQVPTHGTFYIYWGESDQPVNDDLGDSIGIRSRHPRICYIYWKPLRYGTGPTQPQMEYVIGWNCAGTTLQQSDYFLDDGESAGVNGAHILHALLNGGKFMGAGLPLYEIDNDSLEDLGMLMETEHLPCNFSIIDGPEVARPLQGLLQDMGVVMPIIDGRLAFLPQRYVEGATLPVLNDDVISPPDIEQENDLYPASVTRPVFTVKDESGFNFREQDVVFNDAGQEESQGLTTSERVLMPSFSNLAVASKAARRRWQESTVGGSYKVTATRGARILVAGQAFVREGLGTFRVTGVKPSEESPEVEIDCVLDTYSLPDIEDDLGDTGGGGNLLPAAEDIAFNFFEVPAEFQTGPTLEVVVLRLRAHRQIFSADIHLSTNDSTYVRVGSQTHGQGGLLEESLSSVSDDVIVDGPAFEPENDDMVEVLDLSSDLDAWQGGSQVGLLVNSTGDKEVCFIQRFEPIDETDWAPTTLIALDAFRRPTGASSLRFKAISGGTTGASEPTWPTEVGQTVMDGSVTWEAHRFAYRPQNIIRARRGTSKEAFAPGDRLFVADANDLIPYTLDSLGPGQTLYVKTAPRTSVSLVDISGVDPVSGILQGDPTDTTIRRITDNENVRTTDVGDTRIAD